MAMSCDCLSIDTRTAQLSQSKPRDPSNGLAHDIGEMDGCRARDLSRDEGEAGGHQGLARHPGDLILLEHGIQHRIGDLVSDLVGVTLRNRFGCEEMYPWRHFVL